MIALIHPSIWNVLRTSRHVSAVVCKATRIFEQNGIPEPQESAEYLALSAFDSITSRHQARSSLLPPSTNDLNRFISLCEQRQTQRTPIQYLVGDWDFHNITLLVRAPILIPRPETEELVEYLLQDLPTTKAKILDVGCGSGAILLAALHSKSNLTGLGIDIEPEAVKLSKENAKLLGLEDRAEIIENRIEQLNYGQQFDALVSNPPYIPYDDMNQLAPEVINHEDWKALCGGKDGLDVIRNILKYGPKLVKSGGSIWLEIDPSQRDILSVMKFDMIQFVNNYDDLYGNARFCHFRVE